MKPLAPTGLFLALLLPVATGCASHGFPAHGGGKRFFLEQRVVSAAAQEAVASLDFQSLAGKTVKLEVTAMGDQGAGTQSRSESSFGLAGLGGFLGLGSSGVAAGNSTGIVQGGYSPGQYSSQGIANANDVLYLKGLIAEAMWRAGVKIAGITPSKQSKTDLNSAAGTVYVLVHEFGTDQSDFNLFVYSEEKLRSSTALSAFFLPAADGAEPLQLQSIGEGGAVKLYKEAFLFGFGPISGSDITDG